MFTRTDKFREAALHFKEYGTYTKYPKSSRSFLKFWKEEKRRCVEGYNSGDDYITGYHYFYLNYCPIYIVVPELDAKGNVVVNEDGQIRGTREKEFPKFWDGDYQYFQYLEEAEKAGKHGVVLKTRGRGYSFKGAAMLNRNYFLIPGSKSYAIADQKAFLGGEDGILSKAWEQMSFIDEHTAWAKKRHFHDTDMHKRASYKIVTSGVSREKGYMSDIIGVTLKNDPNRARGKRGKLILFEEAGKMPALLQAWQVARPSVEQGGTTFGLMVAFGTGGTEGADFDGLSELFDNPRGYNVLAVDNTRDKGLEGTKCGFFMPEYLNLEGHYDEHGNSDVHNAIKNIDNDRKIILEHTKDKTAYRRYVAEKPINTIEARMKLTGNIFPTTDLLNVLAKLETDNQYESKLSKGRFEVIENGNLIFKEDPKARIIYNYPHKKEDDTDAPVIMYDPPIRLNDDTVPNNIYIAGIDPYDHDQATTSSLGSTFIINKLTNKIVAEYTARPATAKEYYEQVRRMLTFYNAKALYENERKGIFDYFESKQSLHLLCDEPRLIKDVTKTPGVSRRFGLKMNEQIKRYGEGLVNTWLLDMPNPKEFKMNLHNIRSIGLLKELAVYSTDPRKNFDRVMAMVCVMYQLQEEREIIPDMEKSNNFIPMYKRGIFSRSTQHPPLRHV